MTVTLPPAGDVVKIRLDWTTGNPDNISSSFYMAYSGVGTDPDDLTVIAVGVANAYDAHLVSLCSTGITLDEVTVIDCSEAPGMQGTDTASVAGTRAGNIPTDAAALNVKQTIARHYRGGKPKMFLPFGVVGDQSNPNVWDAALLTAFNTQWAAFITALKAISGAALTLTGQVGVSYYKGLTAKVNGTTGRTYYVPTPRAEPVIDPIISAQAQGRIASQRRRRGSS
jgi:hypothetical protein